MPDVFAALVSLAARRRTDPLAPVTVVVPSHAAGLHLRRFLASQAPFAGVRFETLARIAELLAAGHLAAAGRSPLARPIGDYLAEQVALESRGGLQGLAGLPGYGRVLRRLFRRLRRGGIRGSAEALDGRYTGHLPEILRLYDRFRQESSRFYDEEDLLEAAAQAVRSGRAGVLTDLGEVLVVPPAGETAGSDMLLQALREACPAYTRLDEAAATAETRFVLAPDPASEAREVVREIIAALEGGIPLHEIAVLHGADQSYPRLLREAFESAEIPSVPLPGVPLIETPTGRGALGLALLPENQFSRTAVLELLAVAPLREWLPGRSGNMRNMAAAWDKLSREAGVTRGEEVWRRRLGMYVRDSQQAAEGFERQDDPRAGGARYAGEQASHLLEVIETLVERLRPLAEEQAASSFIPAFRKLVEEYFDPSAEGLEQVFGEIEQLGTVAAVQGRFSLATFGQAFRANLEAARNRPRKMGEGVLIADYRMAAGLRFRHVVLSGAYEGVLPAGPGSEPLVEEQAWEELRRRHPFVEDAELRIRRAWAAARRAAAAATGSLIWSAPLFEPGGTREYYPSPAMADAASEKAGQRVTAAQLRAGKAGDWLKRGRSPMAAVLRGPVVDRAEAEVRRAVHAMAHDRPADGEHRLGPVLSMLQARRSERFTEYDGNLAALAGSVVLGADRRFSPTSLERYAACGFRYLCASVLRLKVIEEPEERETIDATARGALVHGVLERFFRERRNEGRPAPGEAWTAEDECELLRIVREELDAASERGLTGLPVFSAHEARTIESDLALFLEEDSRFRETTRAVPAEFEAALPEVELAGVRLHGYVDRVDRTPDGRRAWVIDYKTGNVGDYAKIRTDPLVGGTKLQLPAYLAAAAGAEEVQALYWFITRNGGFTQIHYEPSPENQGLFERTLAAIAGGIGAGVFPAVPGEENDRYGSFQNCQYCDFDRICSRRREYELAAKQEHPDMAPWLGVTVAARGDSA